MLNSTKGQAQRLQREWPWSSFQVRFMFMSSRFSVVWLNWALQQKSKVQTRSPAAAVVPPTAPLRHALC